LGAVKNSHYYARHVGDLKQRLKVSLDHDRLRELHHVRPVRHFLTVGRLVFMTLLCGAALWQTRWAWLWAPAALVQGFNILGYIILLHEQVHECIFRRRLPGLHRLLGLAYAFPAALSATQFRIWHLDHHNELGSRDDDPKRAHLSPKRNRRWYKLLYCTPALFFIYARAAGTEAATYTPGERRTILLERVGVIAGHLALVAALWAVWGGFVALRVYAVPMFLTFPIAFVLNRLGQHYNVDRTDPAKWSTRVDGNPVWHFLFLWSNFHIEHHYYPRVPFYNLRRLNRELHPFFDRNQVPNRTYREILWGWFVLNRKPHTDWDAGAGGAGSASVSSTSCAPR
jgi:fatty acid desaturase